MIDGWGMAGVCLIRLKEIRPRGVPAFAGIQSENVVHRIAVRWREGSAWREGVYIPRRDTASRFNTLVGGRLFLGVHNHAQFTGSEHDGSYRVALDSDDGQTHLLVEAELAGEMPPRSIFASLEGASTFFERGSDGYSPGRNRGAYQGLQLRAVNWKVQPLTVQRVESSFFSNTRLFPSGSCAFDCALLMTGIEHE